jgi:hypothetical protein
MQALLLAEKRHSFFQEEVLFLLRRGPLKSSRGPLLIRRGAVKNFTAPLKFFRGPLPAFRGAKIDF